MCMGLMHYKNGYVENAKQFCMKHRITLTHKPRRKLVCGYGTFRQTVKNKQ